MRVLRVAIVLVGLLCFPSTTLAQQKQPTAIGEGGAAASVDLLATRAAIDALRHGPMQSTPRSRPRVCSVWSSRSRAASAAVGSW